MRIYKTASYEDMSRKAANIIAAQVVQKPESVLGLATGSTPLGLYARLAEMYKSGDVDFAEIRTANLDEYAGLGPDHPQGYLYFMNENLFSKINIAKDSINIPDGMAADADAECRRYESAIDALGGIDLQLLGMGHNGHIGFNEPCGEFKKCTHRVALTESTIQANKRFFSSADEVPRHAYTMGIGTIMQARSILVIVSGAEKADIVKKAFTGPITPEVPASILQLHGNVTLVGDAEALAGM